MGKREGERGWERESERGGEREGDSGWEREGKREKGGAKRYGER